MRTIFTLLVGVVAMVCTGCEVDDTELTNHKTYTLYEDISALVISNGADVIVDDALPHDQVYALTNANNFNRDNKDNKWNNNRNNPQQKKFGNNNFVASKANNFRSFVAPDKNAPNFQHLQNVILYPICVQRCCLRYGSSSSKDVQEC